MKVQRIEIDPDVEKLTIVRTTSEPAPTAPAASAAPAETPSTQHRRRRKDAGSCRRKPGETDEALAVRQAAKDAKRTSASTGAASQVEPPTASAAKPNTPMRSRPHNGRFHRTELSKCEGVATINGPKGRYVVVIEKSGTNKKGFWAIALYCMKDRLHAFHKYGGFWIDEQNSLELPDESGEWTVKGSLVAVEHIGLLCDLVYGKEAA